MASSVWPAAVAAWWAVWPARSGWAGLQPAASQQRSSAARPARAAAVSRSPCCSGGSGRCAPTWRDSGHTGYCRYSEDRYLAQELDDGEAAGLDSAHQGRVLVPVLVKTNYRIVLRSTQLALTFLCRSAPRSSKYRHISRFPSLAAMCSGVRMS